MPERPIINERIERAEELISLLQARANGSSAVTAQSYYPLVFRPGAVGTLPANVFPTWAALISSSAATADVPLLIGLDGTSNGNAVTIPAGAAFTGHTQQDINIIGVNFPTVTVAPGATISGLNCISHMTLVGTNTAPWFVTPVGGGGGLSFLTFDDVFASTTGGAPLVRAGAGSILTANLRGVTVFSGGAAVINSDPAGFAGIACYDNITLGANTIGGGAAAQIAISSNCAIVSATQSVGTTFTSSFQNIPTTTLQTSAAGAGAGDLFNPAGPGVSYTPKSSRIKILWDSTGNADAATRVITFTPSASSGVLTGAAVKASPGGDAGFTVSASGIAVVTGLTVGVAVTLRVQFAASAGTYASTANGTLIIEDLR